MSNNTLIKGINQYSLEGTPSNKTWTFEVQDSENLLNSSIIEKIKEFNNPVYFNDISCNYWIFDFFVDDVWFEALEVNPVKMYILLNAYL